MLSSNMLVNAKDADEAFEKWIEILINQDMEEDSRDGEVVGEVINAITVIEDPTRCIMHNGLRKMPIRYAFGEFLWYLSGNNKFKNTISKYSKVWERLSDNGDTVNSNYGYCIKKKFGFDQYEYVKELLEKDKNTRRAVIHIKEPMNTLEKDTKDLNCTICLQFFIRNEKLYMTTYMRSNDIWLGFPYDVFNFSALQVLLSMELEVELGTYTHISGSLHLYRKNLETIEKRKANIGDV